MEKVLIIDDNGLALRILDDILRKKYKTILARSGEEGAELARREKPALILLDIIMQGMDGFATLEQLKGNETTMNIPVIFLTGLDDEVVEEKGLMMGAVDYIKKPYNPNVVMVRVRNQISMYQYRRTIETKMAMDGLTGVHNRSDFQQKKQNFWEQALCKKVSLSFFLLDIDFFKRVNDTYGHAIGDSVLCAVADILKLVVKEEKGGYVARYGGEEFGVFLLGASKTEAMGIAEEIRESIMKLGLPNVKSDVCPVVTVSIGGITSIPSEERKVDTMIEEADQYLYIGKKRGRNQVNWVIK